MAKYYIDGTNGSDSNNGTSSTTAWLTLTKYKNSTPATGDEVVIAGNIYEPAGVALNLASKPNITIRQWLPSDGLPTGGTALVPGIAKAVLWGAQPLTAIVSGGWSTAGAAGRRQITLTSSTDIKTLVWKYGQNKDASGRYYGHLYKCSAVGSGAAADGVYDSAANSGGKLDGFFQTGTTLTIDSTFIGGTPTTADFIAAYDLGAPIIQILNATNCTIRGLEFRLAIQRTSGAYAVSLQSCNNTFVYDCIAHDASHHTYGISNGTGAGSNCGFVRCVGMGLFGIDGAGTNILGGGSFASSNENGRQDGGYYTDCEFHIFASLAPQVNSTTGLAYPTFRSSGDYTGTPSRNAACFGNEMLSTGGTVNGCSNLVVKNCLFRMYRDTIKASAGNNAVFYGGGATNGYGTPSDPNNIYAYSMRFEDCQFIDAPRIAMASVKNTAFLRCRFLMTQVEYQGQTTTGSFTTANQLTGTDNWYAMFDSCDIVTSLYHASSDAYMFYSEASGAQGSFYHLIFRNCRIVATLQRDASSARTEYLVYPARATNECQTYYTFQNCIMGYDEQPKTNVTNGLLFSEGSAAVTNGKLVFAGNIYRNIGASKYGSLISQTTAATFLNRSTGVDTSGAADQGPDMFVGISWGGPLAGASSSSSMSQVGYVPPIFSVSQGLGGHRSTGSIGPWQGGPTTTLIRGLRARTVK